MVIVLIKIERSSIKITVAIRFLSIYGSGRRRGYIIKHAWSAHNIKTFYIVTKFGSLRSYNRWALDQMDRQTIQADRSTDWQMDRQADRQTNIYD